MTLVHTLEPARTDATTVVATLYVNDACECSRKALDVLDAACLRHPHLAVDVIDIAADPALASRYGAQAPVVVVGGKVRFKGLVNPVLLDRLLGAGSP